MLDCKHTFSRINGLGILCLNMWLQNVIIQLVLNIWKKIKNNIGEKRNHCKHKVMQNRLYFSLFFGNKNSLMLRVMQESDFVKTDI